MRGKTSFEEAYDIPSLLNSSRDQAALYIAPKDLDRYLSQVKNPTGERLDLSNKHGIGYTIYSLTVPGVQGIADKAKAEKHAYEVNDWIANEIKDHRDRIGAFTALSMHDPTQAAQELERCVKRYGFHGALVNNFQHAGPSGETYLFYDQPIYDIFWKKCVELGVPLYLYPSALSGNFAIDVSLHVMGLITNRVFDRHPKLQLLIGHLGERMSQDFWRINYWLEDVERPLAGYFLTETVKYVADSVGADHIMFSVDSLYERVEAGADWYDNDKDALIKALGSPQAYLNVGRENTKKLLKLNKYHDSDA